MTHRGYVELHCHSSFSFLDGASQPEELVLRAHELGYTALALTDHNGLYGSMVFARAARAWQIQPITGVEISLERGLGAHFGNRPAADPHEAFHLTLLAETQRGYANLCRIITAAHRGREKGQPLLDPSFLEGHAEGIICLSGCRWGEIPRLLDERRLAEAARVAETLRQLFGRDNFFLELQQNYAYGDTPRMRALAELGRELGIPLVATGNVHYHDRRRHQLQDVLVAIRHRTTLDGCHAARRPNAEYHLDGPAQVAARFADFPDAVANTLHIAERCRSFDLTQDLGYRFPDFHGGDRGETADEALERICREELSVRYASEAPALRREAEDRLREELRLVRLHGLSGFFLIYRDLLCLADQVATEVRGPSEARRVCRLPAGRGRGSSVGSIICYLIGLSHVDPVKARLFLGRFLNEELASVPDIDLDFARDIREQLILRVYERYGHDHAALVCTFPTYRLRSAVREVGKALGLPEPDLDKLAKLSEGWSEGDQVREEMARLPEFRDRLEAPVWSDLIRLCGEISGFPRHVSQHVGGMIISSRPLVEIVPVEPARMEGRFVCQWDKDSCDDARFIKVDFLGLGMLSLVEEAVEHIYREHGEVPDLSRIDFGDQAVYDDICRGDTVGVFQIESRAQMQMLPRTQPRNLEDLAIEIAIIRPGPIVGGAVNPYARRRQARREDPSYEPEVDHELLRPCLSETLGVILFQDQVLEVAIALAGFSPGQAEALRRAMSRKRSREAMEEMWRQFRDGALRKGVAEETARVVFDKLTGFSEFGFPKAHSASFAVLAFQSAWLRHYYPAEYYTALLNNQPMGFYPPHVFIRDAQRHGVRIAPPDVNLSMAKCQCEGGTIRVGFGYIRGVGKEMAERIESDRLAAGPFRSLGDFVQRLALPREVMENMISVGVFDSFGRERRELLWELGLLRPDLPVHRDRQVIGRQLTLAPPVEPDMVVLEPMPVWDKMLADYRILRFSPEHHPIALIRAQLPAAMPTSDGLASLQDGTRLQMAGLVVARQRPVTAKGFVFLLLEDEAGMVNVIVRPDLYEKRRAVIRAEPLIVVTGTLQRRDEVVNVLATDVRPLRRGAPLERMRRAAPPAHNFG